MTPFDFSRCPDYCSRIRKIMIRRAHPLIAKGDEEPAPSLIPVEQALAMELEARDDLRARLAICEANIKVLRDCAQ
jgi:hypothetical protein